MEAAVANLIEPGETILVGNTGIWGVRAAELASRYGGECRLMILRHGTSLDIRNT